MIMTARARSTDGIDGKDAVRLYPDAVAKTLLLSAEEEVQLARAIEVGPLAREILDDNETTSTDTTHEELEQLVELDDQTIQRFIKANLRLVISAARKHSRTQMLLLDLVREGNTGLVRAIKKFDYTKGFKSSTYVTWWVRQVISCGIAQQGRVTRLPVHVAEQANQVSAVRRNLERILGREPEVDEITDEPSLVEEKAIDLIHYACNHVSLDAPVETDGDTALGDLVAHETAPDPDEVVLDMEECTYLDGMLSAFGDCSVGMVRRRYGLLDGRQAKLASIGQHQGITAERVRQIERLALAEMREYQAAA